jgi:hypothetical protein
MKEPEERVNQLTAQIIDNEVHLRDGIVRKINNHT